MDIYIPVTLIGTVSIYYGYLYGKSYLEKHIIDRVMGELNKKQDEEGVVFKPLEKTKSAVILYKHGGKEHKVCVPYDRTKTRHMLRKQVFLVLQNDKNLIITHKPGVPYLLSAKDMGGSKIIVTKDGKTVREYEEDEVPNYLE